MYAHFENEFSLRNANQHNQISFLHEQNLHNLIERIIKILQVFDTHYTSINACKLLGLNTVILPDKNCNSN